MRVKIDVWMDLRFFSLCHVVLKLLELCRTVGKIFTVYETQFNHSISLMTTTA